MTEESRAAQIERAIREVAGLDVVVEESDGVILLEGVVDYERDSQAAEDIAADLSGGLNIDNSLEIENELPGTRLACLHRTGALRVGDIAVICAASAPHRGEAFSACRELIDRLKARVPIWKREHGDQGPYWIGWQDVRAGV